MKKRLKKLTAILIAVVMFVSSGLTCMAASGDANAADKPSQELELNDGPSGSPSGTEVMDCIESLIGCISEFASMGGDFSNVNDHVKRLMRTGALFNGVTGIAGGAVAILQMCGIIEDPTTAALSKIISEIGNVQDQLRNMDKKLDDITLQLIELSSSLEEKDRQNIARNMLTKWQNFNKEYKQTLDGMINKYKGYIDQAVKDWLAADHSEEDPIYVLYTTLEGEDTPVATYSIQSGIPQQADNFEAVSDYIGMPSKYIPVVPATSFNVNTYATDLESQLTQTFIEAANAGDLVLKEGSTFYTTWGGLTDAQKKAQAENYAKDLTDTIIYKVSCVKMTEENQFVIDVMNTYTDYCNVIVAQDDGLNALLKVMYCTHCFEKEIRDDIVKYCRGMRAMTGTYGMFALGCAAQSTMQTGAAREKLRDLWYSTDTKLQEIQEKNITGKDNYCYLKHQLLDFGTANYKSSIRVDWEKAWTGGDRLVSYSKTDWNLVDDSGNTISPSIMDNTFSTVLYHYYLSQKAAGSTETFVEFMEKNGAKIPDKYKDLASTDYLTVVTNLRGPTDYSLSEHLWMYNNKCIGTWFNNNDYYYVYNGEPSKADQSKFVVLDKVTVDRMYLTGGTIKPNDTFIARALYYHHSTSFKYDEASVLSYNAYTKVTNNGEFSRTVDMSNYFLYLGLEPVVRPVQAPGEPPTALDDFEYQFSLEGAKSAEAKIAEATLYKVTGFKARALKGRKAKITWKANTKATRYEIKYSLKKSMKKAKTVTVKSAKTRSATLKKLRAKKRYYVRMRPVTYVLNTATGKKTKVYGKWTAIKSFKAK